MTTSDIAGFSKTDLIDLVQHQRCTIREQREKLRWYEDTLGNSALPINTRLTMIATKKLVDTRKAGDDGYYRAHLPALAETV